MAVREQEEAARRETKQHIIQVKELKFRPNTDDHDYDFKKNHAIRFLTEGNRVKAVVQFRGREIAHTDLGKKLLIRFAQDLTAVRHCGRSAAAGRPQRARDHQSDQEGQSKEPKEAKPRPRRRRKARRCPAASDRASIAQICNTVVTRYFRH